MATTARKRRSPAARLPRKRDRASELSSAVWVTWEAAAGVTITQGRLQALDNRGFVEIVVGTETLWIARHRVFSVSTRPAGAAQGEAVEQASVAEAAALIEAAAEKDETPSP